MLIIATHSHANIINDDCEWKHVCARTERNPPLKKRERNEQKREKKCILRRRKKLGDVEVEIEIHLKLNKKHASIFQYFIAFF